MKDKSSKKFLKNTGNKGNQANKVPMVDRPNVVKRPSSGERMVPGINCFRNKMNTGKITTIS